MGKLYGQPFSDAHLQEWTTVSGKWTLAPENLVTYLSCNAAEGLARIVTGDPAWTDYSVEVRARADQWFSEPNGDYGIIVRYTDTGNYYLFLYDNNPKVMSLIIQKKVGGVLTTLAHVPFPYDLGRWYTFKGTVVGNTLKFEVDGQEMLTAEAAEVASGPAGLLVWLAEVRFDGFEVASL